MTAVTSGVAIAALPATIEVCARLRDGLPCGGVIWRAKPDLPYCQKCGGTEPGVVYTRGPA